jgi:hypothetical protein
VRKNTKEVFHAWLRQRRYAKHRAIWTNGFDIYSYDTCIVAWGGSLTNPDICPAVFNTTSYSRTTSRHQRSLLELLHIYYPYPLEFVDYIPRGTTGPDLWDFCHSPGVPSP